MGARLSGPAGQAGVAAEQNADINVTPFVDIMLVLLIIFMVAAPLATVSMKLDLPPAPLDAPPAPDPVYVSVQKTGDIFIGDRKSSLQTLAPDVCAALGGGDCTDERVFVRGEAETRYGQFMTVMSDLHSHGFTKVGLINEDID
ncbi:MAG: biopolymer transporter ExbD [Brevundimonas sp.]|nr:MAG: biopolymer transporter ExbD [Brevundimonas sp.]